MTRSILSFLALSVFAVAGAFAQGFGGSAAAVDGYLFVGETNNPSFSTSVYVFTPGEDGWAEAQRLTNPDGTETADQFGSVLAAEGHHVLIGAPEGNGNAGGAYLFGSHDGGPFEAMHTLAPEGETAVRFGRAVALDHHVAAVAAEGKVYIFDHNMGNMEWTQSAVLMVDGADDSFGEALAIHGDHLLIGASSEIDGAGSVYAFMRSEDGWTEIQRITSNRIDEGGALGLSIALQGDQALIGAPRAMGRLGTVLHFAFNEEALEWDFEAILAPPAIAPGRRGSTFGSSIAFAGGTAWVGAPGAASVFAYTWDDVMGTWAQSSRLDLGANASGAGSAVAIAGDVGVVGASGIDRGEGGAIPLQWTDSGWERGDLLINESSYFASISGGLVECEADAASGFPCKDVDMQSFVNVGDLGGDRGIRANDIWGWQDPDTGREYALVGLTDQTSFVDVTDPYSPVVVGTLDMTEGANASVWRDIKVYQDHAYIVADGAGPHGMQVFDLAHLGATDPADMPVEFEADVLYTDIASSHNIVINEESGFGYSVGGRQGGITCGGGLHMIDLREPKKPTFVGCFQHEGTGRRGNGETHDAQCVTYNGPDADYAGREVCFNSSETAVSIADVTDKDNPVVVALATYPSVAYTHQGWLNEDQTFFYVNDELDEPRNLVPGTRTLIYDVRDLDDPVLVKEHISDNSSATDHNLYVKGNLMYQSNYVAGLRILDISDPANPVEVAHFDTVPYGGNDQGTGGGSWSNYPYFESGTIIVTSSREGLFVVKKSNPDI